MIDKTSQLNKEHYNSKLQKSFNDYKKNLTALKNIKLEKKKIGTTQSELAQKCMDFFDFSDDWLYEDYWK